MSGHVYTEGDDALNAGERCGERGRGGEYGSEVSRLKTFVNIGRSALCTIGGDTWIGLLWVWFTDSSDY